MSKLLKISEVARRFTVSTTQVHRLIQSKKLTAFRIGRDFRVSEREVNRFLNDCKTFSGNQE